MWLLQVIGAVGFMDQRLDIPKDVDPQWIAIIESCWHRFVLHNLRFITIKSASK